MVYNGGWIPHKNWQVLSGQQWGTTLANVNFIIALNASTMIQCREQKKYDVNNRQAAHQPPDEQNCHPQ